MTVADELSRPRLDGPTERRVKADLARLPWCWPRDEGDRRFKQAQVVSGLEAPPSPRPGEVILLAVSGIGGSVWATMTDGATGRRRVHVNDVARRAWRDAARAIPRCLPVLWQSLRPYEDHLPQATCLSDEHVTAQALDGPSFGLSFVLALASRMLEMPIPFEWAASAGVSASGHVLPVDGLAEKLTALAVATPSVRRVLVEPSQERSHAALATRLGITLVGVRSAGRAIECVLGDAPLRVMAARGEDANTRRAMCRALFRLVMPGRAELACWAPVAAAAAEALKWSDLSDAERHDLEFARDVALRHENARSGTEIRFDEARWAVRPEPLRTDVLAHLVQQAADWGTPEPTTMLRVAEARLKRGPDAGLEMLRLQGALGRLLLAMLELDRAQEHLTEAVDGYVERLQPAEMSRAWCAAAVVASARGDLATLEHLREVREVAESSGELTEFDIAFMRLAESRAGIVTGRDVGRITSALQELGDSSHLPGHLRCSAWRWAVRAAWAMGDARAAERLSCHLRAVPPGEGTTWQSLLDLDDAVRLEDDVRCATALQQLVSDSPPAAMQRAVLGDAAPLVAARRLAVTFPY